MHLVTPRRCIAFVSVLLFLIIEPVFAHALPGTTLIFSRSANQLNLSIAVPVEELVIAENTLAAVSEFSPNAFLPVALRSQIESYFINHISLQKNGLKLALDFSTITIDTASHEDVGTYNLLKLKLTSELPNGEIWPLILRYDAIMHEVRTHRASVYWSDDTQNPQQLSELLKFGFNRVNGQQKALELDLQ